MLAALNLPDYSVLVLYLLLMVGIGAWFSRGQHNSEDFFLAGRAMGWFPVGLSIMATLLSALSYTGVPGEAYYVGLKYVLFPAAIWLTVPLMMQVVLPLYHRLNIFSVYTYLEMRFDNTVRMVSSLAFIAWRLLWLGGVLYAPCKVLVVAAGLSIPEPVLLIVLGVISTAYTFLGGMKAVLWTDVVQALVMGVGLIAIVLGVWMRMDGGVGQVWGEVSRLQRSELFETTFDWSSKWSIWAMVPHVFFSMLSFYIADQITAQRYLTARDLPTARRSFMLNCLSVTVMVPALAYVGLSLLAFYQSHPQEMRPVWVVNLNNPEARTSLTDDDGQALLDWRIDGSKLDRGTVERATVETWIEQGRLTRPNTKEPFTAADIDRVWDQESSSLRVDRLAMRDPATGEVLLNKKAKDELLPRFITEQLPAGVAGLILAALFAASMSSMDSGLNSISTLIITDFYRRLGWGRGLISRLTGKHPDKLDDADELKMARILVVVIGLAATAFSMVVGQLGSIFDIMVGVINTMGGPLTAIFLLGILTRRTTATAALLALVFGTLFTLWIMASTNYSSLSFLWPFAVKPSSVWPVTFGVIFTFVLGYLLSFVVGRPKSDASLRGLVVGIGTLGEPKAHPEEASIEIRLPEEDAGDDDRWR